MQVIIRIGSAVHTKVEQVPFDRYVLSVTEEESSFTLRVEQNELARELIAFGLEGMIRSNDMYGAGYIIPISIKLLTTLRSAKHRPSLTRLAHVQHEQLVYKILKYAEAAYASDYVTYPGINFSFES